MPLGCLLGHDNIYNLPEIKPEQLIYIGLRDTELYEDETIKSLGVESYTMEDLQQNPLNEILTNIYNKTEAIHLSFDVDVLDPKCISSTGTPVEGGISFHNAYKIINRLSPKIISVDIVEFNPLLGTKEKMLKERESISNLIELFD